MTRMHDDREEVSNDEADFLPGIDETNEDDEALSLKNDPLAEEKKIEEDDTGND